MQDRQLLARERIFRVGEDLVAQRRQRIVARMQPGERAIGGEEHVPLVQRHRLRGGDRLFAGGFHVKAGLALPVRAEQPVVEGAGEDHRAQALDQRFGRQVRIPRADRAVIIVQHPNQLVRQVAHMAFVLGNVGAAHRARFAAIDVGKADLGIGPRRRLGHVKLEAGEVRWGHAVILLRRGSAPLIPV